MRSPFLVVARETVELAFRALEDAEAEIEAFEKGESWYTASQKMMDRIEKAKSRLEEYLK